MPDREQTLMHSCKEISGERRVPRIQDERRRRKLRSQSFVLSYTSQGDSPTLRADTSWLAARRNEHDHNHMGFALGLTATLILQRAEARPIAYAHSTTAMVDYTADKMSEVQLFYAPKSFISFGLGHMDIEGGGSHAEHEVTYFRVNFLAKRWNMEAAQANIFAWGGLDSAHMTQIVSLTAPPTTPMIMATTSRLRRAKPPMSKRSAPLAGMPAARSTLKPGVSIPRSRPTITTHRPSRIAWTRCNSELRPTFMTPDDLATWLVVSGTRYSGNASGSHEEDQLSFLLRFFKKRMWIEAGATTDGKLQARAMFSL